MSRKYTKSADFSEVRKAAWETRRKSYGAKGHAGSYTRSPALLALAVRLMNEGVLSEGQVAKASGLDRVAIRKISENLT